MSLSCSQLFSTVLPYGLLDDKKDVASSKITKFFINAIYISSVVLIYYGAGKLLLAGLSLGRTSWQVMAS